MVILDPYGMTFDAVGVFSTTFWFLFKSGSSYCALKKQISNLATKQLRNYAISS